MPNNTNERKGKQAGELSAEERFRNFFSTSVIDLPEEMTRRDEPAPVEEKTKAGLLGKLFGHDKEETSAPAQPVLEIPTGEILLGADAKPVQPEQEDMALELRTADPIPAMPMQPARVEPAKAVPAEPVPAPKAAAAVQPQPEKVETGDAPLNLDAARRFAAVLEKEQQLMQDAQAREELAAMHKTTTAICDWLEAHPESQPKTRRFAEYYIPTTLKLLHTYNDVQGQQGENAETIRRDIAGILHTLNQAYENLYNNLLSDVAMDISSEIAALQGMLANDGLTGREFE